MKKHTFGLSVQKISAAALLFCVLSQPVLASPIGTFRENDRPERSSQLDSGLENSVSYQGEWKIPVAGNSVVAVGAGEVPNQFVFSDPRTGRGCRSSLLAGAFPVTEQTESFYSNWGASVAYMTAYLKDLFGEKVNFVSFDNIIQPAGGNVYVFYFELWDDDWKTTYPITVAYRFHQSYYLFAMGVNLGDLPEIFQITKQAAADFIDYTDQPMTGWQVTAFTGTYRHTLPAWKYDVINPFQILMEHLYE